MNRTAHAFEPRLVVAREALVGLLERGHQRLGAAGECALLQGHAHGRLDIGDNVLIARARHRLQQLLDLRALHRRLGHTGFEQCGLGGGFARQLLRRVRQHTGLGGLRLAVGLAAHQFRLEAPDALLRVPGQTKRGQRRAAARDDQHGQQPGRQGSVVPIGLRRRGVADGGGVQGGDDCRQASICATLAQTAATVGGASKHVAETELARARRDSRVRGQRLRAVPVGLRGQLRQVPDGLGAGQPPQVRAGAAMAVVEPRRSVAVGRAGPRW